MFRFGHSQTKTSERVLPAQRAWILLDVCREKGIEPYRSFSGRFNVRLSLKHSMAKAVRRQRDPKLFGIGDAFLEKLEASLGKSLFHIHAQGRAAIILQGLANIIDDVGEFAHGSWLIVTQWQSPPSRPYSP